MFGNPKEIQLPIFTDKIKLDFIETKNIDWEELIGKGIIKEVIDDDGDIVTITKSFKAYDMSFERVERIVISKEQFIILKEESYDSVSISYDIQKLKNQILKLKI